MEINDKVGLFEDVSRGPEGLGPTGGTATAGLCQSSDTCPPGYYCDFTNSSSFTGNYGICKPSTTGTSTCPAQGTFIECGPNGLAVYAGELPLAGQSCKTYLAAPPPNITCGTTTTCPPVGTFIRCTGIQTSIGGIAEFSNGLQNGVCSSYTAVDGQCSVNTALCSTYLGQAKPGYVWQGQVILTPGLPADTTACTEVQLPPTPTSTSTSTTSTTPTPTPPNDPIVWFRCDSPTQARTGNPPSTFWLNATTNCWSEKWRQCDSTEFQFRSIPEEFGLATDYLGTCYDNVWIYCGNPSFNNRGNPPSNYLYNPINNCWYQSSGEQPSSVVEDTCNCYEVTSGRTSTGENLTAQVTFLDCRNSERQTVLLTGIRSFCVKNNDIIVQNGTFTRGQSCIQILNNPSQDAEFVCTSTSISPVPTPTSGQIVPTPTPTPTPILEPLVYLTPSVITFEYEKNSQEYPAPLYFSVVNPASIAREISITTNPAIVIEPRNFTLPPQSQNTLRVTVVRSILEEFNVGLTQFTPIVFSPPTVNASNQSLHLTVNVNVKPFKVIPINFSTPIISASYEFLDQIFETFVDETRELKTLLNIGDDRQHLLLNYRYGTKETSGANTLQVKLLQPLQSTVTVGDSVFISRELNKTVIDKVRIKAAPDIDVTPYLRPPNTAIPIKNTLGVALNNITLNTLQTVSGSVGKYTNSENYSFEDEVYRKWYSFDFNSTELNIDFSDYKNFVFYGSAGMRLEAFKLKLLKLEELERQRQQFSGNVFTGTLASAGAKYLLNQSQKYSTEKESLIRGFDRYEQYLYFTPSGSNSPYSASFEYVDTGTEYNTTGYWPKDVNNNIISPSNIIASNWYADQLAIAQRFDEYNENNLVNTIPTHIREDEESAPYITFVTMIGHFFDLLKPYIDQYPQIYDRYINPNERLSKDLVTDIADALGFKLPSFSTSTPLSEFFTSTTPKRDIVSEIQKRILHNLVFFVKAKGSKSALNVLLRATGLPESILMVRESGPAVTDSYYSFNEFSTGIEFVGNTNEYIILPLSSSNRNPFPRSIQLNISVDVAGNYTLLTGDNKWALNIKQHPTNKELGRFELVSGSSQVLLLSSSYQELFNDELIGVSLRTYNTESYASLFVGQTYGEDIIFTSSMQEASGSNVFLPLWTSSQNLYIGGPGILVTNRFRGTVDEIRYWGTNLSNEVTLANIFDPGASSGEQYTDPVNYLYGQISFNKIDTGSFPTFIRNESSYYSASLITPALTFFSASGFTTQSVIRYNRQVRQLLTTSGNNTYLTTKIKIAPPPQFKHTNLGYKELSRTQSIVTVDQKLKKSRFGNNKVIVATSPTEIINQNIIRNLGAENTNVLLGAPSNNIIFDTAFKQLKKYYEQYYYVDVNFNRYIRVLSRLNSVLSDVIQYFIPSRATLYNGIVIEPNILDKTKIPLLKKLRVYGAGARKTISAVNSLTSSAPDYGATFNVSTTIQSQLTGSVYGSYPYYTSSIVTKIGNTETSSSNALVKAHYVTYTSSIDKSLNSINAQYKNYQLQHLEGLTYTEISQSYVSGSTENVTNPHTPWPNVKITMVGDINKFRYNATNLGAEGSEPYGRVYSRKLFQYEILSNRIGGTSSLYINALHELKPSCNFDEVETYTYFNQPFGIYYYPTLKYTPVYQNPLNEEWDFNTQAFTSASTWEFGSKYNLNDVVYQNVTDAFLNTRNLSYDTAQAIKSGNKKYYVFKTRPDYRNPGDGTAWNVNSTPSYLPPSIDRENWQRVRFVPYTKLEPRRIVFETFTVSDPALNNFLTTTVNINRTIDAPTRYVSSFDVGPIGPTVSVVGDLALENISVLFAIQATHNNIRVRLYRTQFARDADITRNLITTPTPDAGVLLDTIISSTSTSQLVNPTVTLVAGNVPPLGKLYYTIDNLDVVTRSSVQISLYYLALQVQSKIPTGYLRKHYRFFRDNSTATKRRNYDGCKNTSLTTIDGLPVVQIFVGEGTELNALPSSRSNEIIIGGGGTLNVT